MAMRSRFTLGLACTHATIGGSHRMGSHTLKSLGMLSQLLCACTRECERIGTLMIRVQMHEHAVEPP